MRFVAFNCSQCGIASSKATGKINRARKAGLNLYCSRLCSGLGRRKHRTDAELRQRKAEYDAERRIALADQIKAEKAARHKLTYDPEKARIKRAERMPLHVEYCRQPEYRSWKKTYDRTYRAKRLYGPFWEAATVLLDVETEVRARATDYEIRVQNGTLNKALQRKRTDVRSHRQ